MLAAERLTKIVELVTQSGVVQVEELSRQLGVSAMTVRRDLDKLKKAGLLQRCHGGAVLTNEMKFEQPYEEKQASNSSAKVSIARACCALVSPGDSVFLDAGTTTFQIAGFIKTIPDLTILTNDLKVATLLLESSVNLIFCGGEIQKSTGSAIGHLTQQMIKDLRVNVAFFGAACVDEEFVIATPTIGKAYIKKSIMAISNKNYLVVDASKFYRQALVKVASMSDFTGVLTDKQFTATELRRMRDKKITLLSLEEEEVQDAPLLSVIG